VTLSPGSELINCEADTDSMMQLSTTTNANTVRIDHSVTERGERHTQKRWLVQRIGGVQKVDWSRIESLIETNVSDARVVQMDAGTGGLDQRLAVHGVDDNAIDDHSVLNQRIVLASRRRHVAGLDQRRRTGRCDVDKRAALDVHGRRGDSGSMDDDRHDVVTSERKAFDHNTRCTDIEARGFECVAQDRYIVATTTIELRCFSWKTTQEYQ
jgi:hypothetical protein